MGEPTLLTGTSQRASVSSIAQRFGNNKASSTQNGSQATPETSPLPTPKPKAFFTRDQTTSDTGGSSTTASTKESSLSSFLDQAEESPHRPQKLHTSSSGGSSVKDRAALFGGSHKSPTHKRNFLTSSSISSHSDHGRVRSYGKGKESAPLSPTKTTQTTKSMTNNSPKSPLPRPKGLSTFLSASTTEQSTTTVSKPNTATSTATATSHKSSSSSSVKDRAAMFGATTKKSSSSLSSNHSLNTSNHNHYPPSPSWAKPQFGKQQQQQQPAVSSSYNTKNTYYSPYNQSPYKSPLSSATTSSPKKKTLRPAATALPAFVDLDEELSDSEQGDHQQADDDDDTPIIQEVTASVVDTNKTHSPAETPVAQSTKTDDTLVKQSSSPETEAEATATAKEDPPNNNTAKNSPPTDGTESVKNRVQLFGTTTAARTRNNNDPLGGSHHTALQYYGGSSSSAKREDPLGGSHHTRLYGASSSNTKQPDPLGGSHHARLYGAGKNLSIKRQDPLGGGGSYHVRGTVPAPSKLDSKASTDGQKKVDTNNLQKAAFVLSSVATPTIDEAPQSPKNSNLGTLASMAHTLTAPISPTGDNNHEPATSVVNVPSSPRRKAITRMLSDRVTVPTSKVPKVVKSLQSGSFQSASNILPVLEECWKLIHERPGMQYELGKYNDGVAMQLVVKIMTRFEENESIALVCCRIIRDMCEVHDQNRILIGKTENGIQPLLVAVLSHENNMDIQRTGLQAMARLAVNDENKSLIADMNGLEVLKTCMEFYIDYADLQIECMRVTAALAEMPLHSRSLAAIGISKLVVAVMRQYPKDATLQLHACAAIRNLTETYDVSRGQLAGRGVLELILDAMKRYPNNAELQANGCFALWHCADGHSMNADVIMKADRSQTGFIPVLTAMKKHPSDTAVQGAACGVLKLITEDHHHSETLGHEGAIQRVLTSMRQHEMDKLIQAQGCGALCNMAVIPEHKEPIMKAGGIGMIVFAMKQLEDEADVQKSGCKALRQLGLHTDDAKVSIASTGGIKAILAAMDKHSSNKGVQVLALGALQPLVKISRGRTVIIQNKGAALIEKAMKKLPDDKHVEKQGWEILEALLDSM